MFGLYITDYTGQTKKIKFSLTEKIGIFLLSVNLAAAFLLIGCVALVGELIMYLATSRPINNGSFLFYIYKFISSFCL